MAKLLLLSQTDHKRVLDELDEIERHMHRLANIIGPAYGASWCDKALKCMRMVHALRSAVDGRFYLQTETATARVVALGQKGWDQLAGQIRGWRFLVAPNGEAADSAPIVEGREEPVPEFLRSHTLTQADVRLEQRQAAGDPCG